MFVYASFFVSLHVLIIEVGPCKPVYLYFSAIQMSNVFVLFEFGILLAKVVRRPVGNTQGKPFYWGIITEINYLSLEICNSLDSSHKIRFLIEFCSIRIHITTSDGTILTETSNRVDYQITKPTNQYRKIVLVFN